MATKKPSAMDFTRAYLRKKRKASYAEVKAAADKKGLKMYPIVYGRAQSLEGIVKTAAYGTSKKRKEKAARKTGRRGPGRPRKTSSPLDSLDAVINAMRESNDERTRYKRALEKIQAILDDVL